MPGFLSNNKMGLQRANIRYTNNIEGELVMAKATLGTLFSNYLHEAKFDEVLTPEEMSMVIDNCVDSGMNPHNPEGLSDLIKGTLQWRQDNFIDRDEMWTNDDSNDRQDDWYFEDNDGNPVDSHGNPLATDDELAKEYYILTGEVPTILTEEGYKLD
jgi:hypothetical protein